VRKTNGGKERKMAKKSGWIRCRKGVCLNARVSLKAMGAKVCRKKRGEIDGEYCLLHSVRDKTVKKLA
jgi:hypothetical protein